MFLIFLKLFVCQVVVQRVHLDGLGRTKEDLLTYEIADVFQARNLIDVSALESCTNELILIIVSTPGLICCAGNA